MFPFSYRNVGLEYVLIHPWEWERLSATDPWLRGYEVLDLWHAQLALVEIAADRHGFEILRELAPEVLLGLSTTRAPPGSYEHWQEERRMIERLQKEALGTIFSKRGERPDFARFYICRRKRVERAPTPLPNPWQDVQKAIEAAKQAPRGFVVLETTTDGGDPAPHVRLEVLLADGEVLTRSTDAHGQLRLEPIPQGRCTIRVPALDGSAWYPAEGQASSRIERGHKQLHIVKKGENLTRIAQDYGIKGWRKLWEEPANDKLRKKRRSPHALLPGDELIVPAIEIHEITRPTDQVHRIVLSEELVEFRVVLQDHNQQPFSDEAYELRIDSSPRAAPRRGTTDGSGKVVEQVPSAVQRLELKLPDIGLSWTFLLSEFVERPSEETEARRGDEDALMHTVKAAQLRLNALGFPCGDADGRLGSKTLEALALSGQPAESPQGESVGERALAALDHVEPLFTRTV